VNGKTIHELLLDARIFPDVEAFTLVYSLNPETQDLRNLALARIRIPKVEHGAKLEVIFAQGFQVWLTVEKERKQKFRDSVQKMTTLIETVQKFGVDKFQNQAARDEFVNSLNRSSEILGGIAEQLRERYGRPIPNIVLTELYSETQLLVTVINAKATTTTKFDQRDQNAVKDVETDLIRKSRAFTEVAAAGDPSTQYTRVEVSVKTLQAGRPIPALRIWFAPKFSRDAVDSFGALTTDRLESPAKATVYEGEYCFWAAKDPDKIPVTNELCQKLWLNRNVELSVIK